MAKTDGSDGSDGQKPPTKNLHVVVPAAFHRRVRMLCVMQGSTLKDYALSALEEKVARDEEEMRQVKEPA